MATEGVKFNQSCTAKGKPTDKRIASDIFRLKSKLQNINAICIHAHTELASDGDISTTNYKQLLTKSIAYDLSQINVY